SEDALEQGAPDDDRGGAPARERADVLDAAHATPGVEADTLARGDPHLLEEHEWRAAQASVGAQIDHVEVFRAAERGDARRVAGEHPPRARQEGPIAAARREPAATRFDFDERPGRSCAALEPVGVAS